MSNNQKELNKTKEIEIINTEKLKEISAGGDVSSSPQVTEEEAKAVDKMTGEIQKKYEKW